MARAERGCGGFPIYCCDGAEGGQPGVARQAGPPQVAGPGGVPAATVLICGRLS